MPAFARAMGGATGTWQLPLLALAISLMLWPTMRQLTSSWELRAENFMGHGWLIAVFVMAALWRESRTVRREGSGPLDWPLIGLALVLGAGWALSVHGAVDAVGQALWPALVLTGIAIAFGRRAARDVWRPVALLLLTVPSWDLLHSVLWTTTTRGVREIVGWLGVPVYFEGNVIHLPHGALEIAGGCAGMAFFTAAIAAASVIAYLNRVGLGRFVVLLVSAAVLAMLSNWLRISIIVFEAYRTEMRTPLITDGHYTFGWILFAVLLFAYCFAFGGYGLDDRSPRQRREPTVGTAASAKPVLVACVAAAFGPALVLASEPRGSDLRDHVLIDPPSDADWRASAVRSAAWYPIFQKPEAEALYQYEKGMTPIYLYAAVYRVQLPGSELISGTNSVFPLGWGVESVMNESGFKDLTVRAESGKQWFIRHSYVSAGLSTGRGRVAQVAYALAQFYSDPAAGIVIIAAACGDSCEQARAQVISLWPTVSPALFRQIEAAGS